MKRAKELQEDRAVLLDEATALTALATEQARELTTEELSSIDSILGQGKPGDVGHVQGAIHKIDENISRAHRLEELQAAQTRQRSGATAEPGQRRVPAEARFRYNRLTCFQGADANYNAYAAGQWFLAVLYGREKSAGWCRDNGICTTSVMGALAGNDNSAGGYLIPEEMEQSIINLRETRGVFRQYARTVPMASDVKNIPRRTGGLTGYWTTDNAQITESQPSYDNVQLVAKKLGAICLYSSEVAEDAVITMADELATEIAYIFAIEEDQAGFLGDGTSTYGGITGLVNTIAAGSTDTAATGNTSFATLDLDDFEAMLGNLPEFPGIDPAWYISKAGWAASMLRLQAAAGGNTVATLGAGPQSQEFLGYPVRFVQVMNSTLSAQTSTDGLAYFGDLAMSAALGTRRGIALRLSEHRYFELDQLAIKGTVRLDIKCHESNSAMRMLATPSS